MKLRKKIKVSHFALKFKEHFLLKFITLLKLKIVGCKDAGCCGDYLHGVLDTHSIVSILCWDK